MKIALLKSRAKTEGGLEKYAKRIASAFSMAGHEVFLLTTGSSAPTHGIAFPVCRWPGFLRLEQYDRCVRRWLEKHPADLIFGMDRNRIQTHLRLGNGVHAAFLKSRIAAEGRFKYASCLLNPLHRKILELEEAAFTHPGLKKIFVNSHMVRSDLLSHYAADPAKIEVVHNGVEWTEMGVPFASWREGRAELCARFGLDPEAFHLLFVGNGYQRKGLEPLLKALALLKRQDVHLSVIGKEKNLSRFQKLAANCRVRFFGPQEKMAPFYQLADAIAIPSYYDPFANVTLEALCFGVFVFSSKTNGGREILTAETGAVIEDLSRPESIASLLETAPRKTTESATRIRNAAARFDFPGQLAKLIDGCL